jgi:Protein of unknown function (DUF3618)
MGQTVDQIEAGIERSRDELGANIHELERRVDKATDWHEQFRLRPFAFLGAAAVGGAVASSLLRRKPIAPAFVAGIPAASMRSSERVTWQRNHGSDVWDNVKAAVLSLAGTRLKEYVEQFLPGFDEHYERAQRSVSAELDMSAGRDPA